MRFAKPRTAHRAEPVPPGHAGEQAWLRDRLADLYGHGRHRRHVLMTVVPADSVTGFARLTAKLVYARLLVGADPFGVVAILPVPVVALLARDAAGRDGGLTRRLVRAARGVPRVRVHDLPDRLPAAYELLDDVAA